MSTPPIPRLRAVDLNLLTVFDALVRERNVTRAAERLGMTQPAVSNALSRLRLVFHDELFSRHGKEMAPTPRARALAEPIRKALDLIQSSLTHSSTFDPSTNHTFRLGIQDLGETLLLPRFLQWIEGLGAGIRLEIRRELGAQLNEEMRLGKVDLVVDHVVIPGDDFRKQHIFDLEFVPMVRQAHPAAGPSLTVDEYLALEHVIIEPRAGQTNLAEQVLALLTKSRHVRVQVPHYLSVPYIVSQSNLVCTVPVPIARLFEQHFSLRILSCPLPIRPIAFFMMWHICQDLHPAHQWLRQTMVELCSNI